MKSVHSRFIRISNKQSEGRYICETRNSLALAWQLYFTYYSSLRRLGFGKKSLMILMAHKLGLNSQESIREIPIKGDLLLETHRGYVAFDLSRKVVIKLFINNIDIDIMFRDEIDTLRKIQYFEFVPTLRRWNASERWYETEYIRGASGFSMILDNGRELIDILDSRIIPCLDRIMMHCPPLAISAEKYADELIQSFKWDRLFEVSKDIKIVKKAQEFIDLCAKRIKSEQYKQILLVFSHGDFGPHNIIVNGKRDFIIDWENAGVRSALYDYYNYIFKVFNEYFTFTGIDIGKGIELLQRRLQSKSTIFENALLPSIRLYRWVYYLEKFALLLTSRWSRGRLREKHVRLIERYLYGFDRFESYGK